MACEYYKNCPGYDSTFAKCNDPNIPCEHYDGFIGIDKKPEEERKIEQDHRPEKNRRPEQNHRLLTHLVTADHLNINFTVEGRMKC